MLPWVVILWHSRDQYADPLARGQSAFQAGRQLARPKRQRTAASLIQLNPLVSLPPDLLILFSIAIVWIKQTVLTSVELHIFMRNDMNRSNEPTRFFTCKRAV